MTLSDKENYEAMHNPERLQAMERLKKAHKRIEEIAILSTQTILSFMPQAIKELSNAHEALIIIEAKLGL